MMSENNPPTTPAEAQARLSTLVGTKEWAEKWVSGSAAHADEYNKLQEMALSGTNPGKVDLEDPRAAVDQIFLDRQRRDNVNTAEYLRGVGIDDPAIISQVLTNEPVSQHEFDAAKSMRSRLERDHDFQKKYLSGDGEAVRQMTLLNVILTRPVKREAAA
jgi:hypothetical protein